MTPATTPRTRQRRPADSWTPLRLAKRYGIKEDKVLTWIRNGELLAMNVATKVKGRPRWIITPASLATFEARRSSVATVAPQKPARRKKPVGYREYL